MTKRGSGISRTGFKARHYQRLTGDLKQVPSGLWTLVTLSVLREGWGITRMAS